MKIEQRNIAVCIVLTIVTCGIYGLYWLVKLNDDTNAVAQDTNAASGVMVIVLTLVTCGIYGIYWAYKMGEKLDNAYTARGLAASSRGILYLVLCIVGLSIVVYALMQDSLNKLPEAQA